MSKFRRLLARTLEFLHQNRNNLDEFKNNYKKSDEYLNLSNSKKKIINRKLDKLGWGNVATAEVDISGIKKILKHIVKYILAIHWVMQMIFQLLRQKRIEF